VIFGLKADQALEEFIDLTVNILQLQDVNAERRTVALKEYIDSLLMKYKVDQVARLLDPNERTRNCIL
jgi:hypothetical protein